MSTGWTAVLDERVRKEVAFARDYVKRFNHGTVGHIGYTALAMLARLLDVQQRPGHQAGRMVLPVSYVSQWAEGAEMTSMDCGPASIKMLLDYAAGGDAPFTVDDIMGHITGGKNRPTSFTELKNAALAMGGVELLRFSGWSWDGLIEALDEGRPSMVLIKNKYFIMRLDRNFTKGHFLVAVGHDVIPYRGKEVRRLIVHDSNWWREHTAQGAFLPIIEVDFMTMWEGAKEDWSNPARAALVLATAP
jgi:hypothetical protein